MNAYPTYKDSGIEWIGDIPKHWDKKRLKYVSNTQPSNVDKKSKEGEQEVFLCNYMDVYKNEFITDDIVFMKATASDNQIQKFTLNKGDVLITKDSEDPTDIAIPALVNKSFEDVVCGYHLTRVRPEADLLGQYFFRMLQAKPFNTYFEVNAKGVTRYGLGTETFLNFETIIPPLPEQTAIANFLDHKTAQIDAAIDKHRQLIELLQEHRAALINEAVTAGVDEKGNLRQKPQRLPASGWKDSGVEWIGAIPAHWEVKRIKYVSKVNPQKGNSNIYKEDSDLVSFLPMEKVSESGKVDYSLKKPINEVYSGFTYFEKDDIIVAKITPCFENGKGALLNEMGTIVGFGSTEFHVLRSFEGTLKTFLFYITRSDVFMKSGETFMTGAAGQRRVPTSFIEDFTFGLPPFEEQQQIVHYIKTETTRIDQEIDLAKQEINLLEEYRQALIAEAVTGKIDVRDYPLT